MEAKSNDKNKKFLQSHLKDNLKSFMNMYENKIVRLAELKREQTDLNVQNVDLKKKWIKKNSDLINTVKGK